MQPTANAYTDPFHSGYFKYGWQLIVNECPNTHDYYTWQYVIYDHDRMPVRLLAEIDVFVYDGEPACGYYGIVDDSPWRRWYDKHYSQTYISSIHLEYDDPLRGHGKGFKCADELKRTLEALVAMKVEADVPKNYSMRKED